MKKNRVLYGAAGRWTCSKCGEFLSPAGTDKTCQSCREKNRLKLLQRTQNLHAVCYLLAISILAYAGVVIIGKVTG